MRVSGKPNIPIDIHGYYSGLQQENTYHQSTDPYSYNSHSTNGEENYQLGSSQYQDIQKHVASGGVPILTSLNEKQRKHVQRQIIALYPDILTKDEAERVRAWNLFSQLSGLTMMLTTPYWLIMIQNAFSEARGSLMKNRLLSRAWAIQTAILFGAYYSYAANISTLDKYSDKYLKSLDDQTLLHFESQDRQAINRIANVNNFI